MALKGLRYARSNSDMRLKDKRGFARALLEGQGMVGGGGPPYFYPNYFGGYRLIGGGNVQTLKAVAMKYAPDDAATLPAP